MIGGSQELFARKCSMAANGPQREAAPARSGPSYGGETVAKADGEAARSTSRDDAGALILTPVLPRLYSAS